MDSGSYSGIISSDIGGAKMFLNNFTIVTDYLLVRRAQKVELVRGDYPA